MCVARCVAWIKTCSPPCSIEVDPGLLAHRILYDAECPQTSSGSDGLLRVAAGSCSFEADSAMCPMFPNNVFAGISCRKLTVLTSNCQSLVAL